MACMLKYPGTHQALQVGQGRQRHGNRGPRHGGMRTDDGSPPNAVLSGLDRKYPSQNTVALQRHCNSRST